ncbi:hypothetical protein [Alkaliphilus serpentinus]|uniref:Uncharacterized protein n=1 Tax=Alkaliphilus serpentinus TaxID=1482731 RepID=A0A833HMU8_9FIRM|nr:hypothetical protein [Alkaliphilus serpentinus]KAB3528792.1 hypothetical protein F8153_10725 [Alkaliphilus serpentinus]
MLLDPSRSIRIVDEIMNYAIHRGARDCHIMIDDKDDHQVEICITCKPIELSVEELTELRESLEIPRQEPVEEYSWELVGENQQYHELNIIGMMTDDSTVEYIDSCLKIRLIRKKCS